MKLKLVKFISPTKIKKANNMKTQIEKLKEQLELEFKEHKHTFYVENFEDNEQYQVLIEDYDEYINRNDIDHIDIKWLVDLSILHQEYSIFKLEKNFKEETLEHLSKSCQYGYYALHYGSQACGCFEDKSPFVIQNKAVFVLSNLLLTSNIDKFEIVANHLIDSLNGKSCIIKKGYKKSNISWFILELVSLYLEKPIELHRLLKPELESPFKDVLENWYTTNLSEVEKYVYLLCDMHIEIAKQNLEVHELSLYGEDDDVREDAQNEYKELFLVGLYQLPFEVLVYLKLRELKGLKNPDFKSIQQEFVHPLLKTKISQFYMNLEKVNLNNDLIYANKLIEKLKKQCEKVKD